MSVVKIVECKVLKWFEYVGRKIKRVYRVMLEGKRKREATEKIGK